MTFQFPNKELDFHFSIFEYCCYGIQTSSIVKVREGLSYKLQNILSLANNHANAPLLTSKKLKVKALIFLRRFEMTFKAACDAKFKTITFIEYWISSRRSLRMCTAASWTSTGWPGASWPRSRGFIPTTTTCRCTRALNQLSIQALKLI